MSRNPFQYLLPVSPDNFVGRWPLVESIALDLTFERGDSYAIIAGRRCGKSSLLLTLGHHLRQPETAVDGEWRPLPLFIDLKNGNFSTEEAIYAYVLNELCRRVDVNSRRRPKDAWPEPVSLEKDWFKLLLAESTLSLLDFQDGVGYILDQLSSPTKPARLILLIDEFDEVLGHAWTNALFNQMRALIVASDLNERVRLVLAGSRRFLDEVSDRGSPLWNVLKLRFLVAFNEESIRKLAARAEGLSEEVVTAVWQQSGGHPFLAQYLLHYFWEDSPSGDDAGAVRRLASRFQHEEVAHLEGWSRAIEAVGRRTYAILAEEDGWIKETKIVRAVQESPKEIRRGLTALWYHALVIHDGSWTNYKQMGDLFKTWFDGNIIVPDSPDDIVVLYKLISKYFSNGELHELCMELEIIYDSLPGQGTRNKARELVAYFDRHGQINQLIRICSQLRPNVNWSDSGKQL
ncbi:MAG: hypothetical protein GY796_20840 [Chloroflexi bacterium]|nr:hypothetical protein [Chloroflexota bacterium]